MTIRWSILAVLALILVGEGYLLFERCFNGPLSVIDWSGRVITLDEKQLLFDEVASDLGRWDTTYTPNDMEFASFVRSKLDTRTVCGMARLKSHSGVWGSWRIIDMLLPGEHALLKETVRSPVLQGMGDPTDGHRLVYRVHDQDREISPRDRFQCEPITCEEKCDRYSWVPIATIE